MIKVYSFGRMKCIMFGEKILDYWDDIMKDLGDIIAIPSVAQPQDGPYPVRQGRSNRCG